MKVFLLITLLVIPGCYNSGLNIATMPKPPLIGPPEYIAGWEAGCETGMSSYSNSYYRTRYSAKVDGHMMNDANYNTGWDLGQRYCSYYTSTYLVNNELSYVSNDEYSKSDLRADNNWFNLKSDGFFSYEHNDNFGW